MSGNGPATGTRPDTTPMLERPAASRSTHGAVARMRATTPASRKSGSPQSAEGRFASVCAKLLPPLPPGRTSSGAGGHFDQPCGLSLRCPSAGVTITNATQERHQSMSSEHKKHRSHLPMPTPERTGLITYDARDPDTKFPPIEQLRPPKGAPNVLVILIDDAGFGSASAFGGPCQTPNAEKLAAGGLKYNRFHTTALCSPTRAALLTGRNHHSVGMGGITEIATGAPGYSSVLPNTMSPVARTLKLNGYSTAQFGKCHEVPVWETSPVGPFDAWPTGGGGFEYFYGFIGGEAN